MLAEHGRDFVYRYRVAPTRGFEYVSPSVTAITGYTPDDHYADPDLGFRIVHPDDRALLARVAAGQGPDPLVIRWLRRDGVVIWTEQYNVEIRDEAGMLIAIEGSARDVTARELAMAALERSDRRLRSMLESDAFLAASIDRDGTVIFVNGALLRATGRTAEQVVGGDWFELFVPAETRDAMRATYRVAVTEGTLDRDVIRELLRHDGSRIRARLHVLNLFDAAGSTAGAAMVGEDLTAAEQEAGRTVRLTAAIEQTADSVVITDAEARIQYVNPAFERVTGYAFEEVLGQNPRILKSGHQPRSLYRRMWRTLASGLTWSGELVNRRRDGSLFVEEATITPIRGADGSVTAYVGVKRDVTRFRELDASLAATRREREQVARTISGLESGPTLEVTADRIAASLLTLDAVDSGLVIIFEGEVDARVLGIASDLDLPLRSGGLLPASRAAYLRERAALGPWVERWRARAQDGDYGRSISAAGIRAVLYVPITNGHGPAGVLSFGSAQPHGSASLAKQTPSAVELASVARTLLAPGLKTRLETAASRNRISDVVRSRKFGIVYQPVVDLVTGRPVGFEALARFTDGTRPDLMFAEAVAAGHGTDLEAATLAAALAGTTGLPAHAWLSLNVSPAMVLEGPRLSDLLAARTRPVALEITEHEAIDDYARLRAALVTLGPDVRIAVDDAGSGIANFAHLVELRPDFVKLDQRLVRGVNADVSRQALAVGLRHFAEASGSSVIAEGIETDAERDMLVELGVHLGQGYLFGRPAPAAHWAQQDLG